jgi:hypothetical protein
LKGNSSNIEALFWGGERDVAFFLLVHGMLFKATTSGGDLCLRGKEILSQVFVFGIYILSIKNLSIFQDKSFNFVYEIPVLFLLINS